MYGYFGSYRRYCSTFLKDVEDEKGKVKPRLVNINSQKARLVYGFNHQYITEEDYEAAIQVCRKS